MPKIKRPVLNLEKDLIVVIILNCIGYIYALLAGNHYLGTAMYSSLIIGVPAMVYMSIRRKKSWKKIGVFSLIIGGLYCFLLEFLAEYNLVWEVPNPSFPYRIFGFLPVFEIVFGHTLMAAYVATFYEHFVDAAHISRKLSMRHVLAGAIPAIGAIILTLSLYFIDPNLVRTTTHLYLIIGILAVVPPICYGFYKSSIFKKMALTGCYFFCFFLVLELIGVKFSYWTFGRGTYVGWVELFGLGFPFEEVFFWMGFYSSFLIFFYEKFIDE